MSIHTKSQDGHHFSRF